MLRKMPSSLLKAVAGLFFVSFFAVACNSGGEKKEDKNEKPKDTPAVVTPTPAPAAGGTDTGKNLMTTDTMPVKTTD